MQTAQQDSDTLIQTELIPSASKALLHCPQQIVRPLKQLVISQSLYLKQASFTTSSSHNHTQHFCNSIILQLNNKYYIYAYSTTVLLLGLECVQYKKSIGLFNIYCSTKNFKIPYGTSKSYKPHQPTKNVPLHLWRKVMSIGTL